MVRVWWLLMQMNWSWLEVEIHMLYTQKSSKKTSNNPPTSLLQVASNMKPGTTPNSIGSANRWGVLSCGGWWSPRFYYQGEKDVRPSKQPIVSIVSIVQSHVYHMFFHHEPVVPSFSTSFQGFIFLGLNGLDPWKSCWSPVRQSWMAIDPHFMMVLNCHDKPWWIKGIIYIMMNGISSFKPSWIP